MGWTQHHCKYYQILIPTTTHGSKSELEQPRYLENRVNASIDAPLTSRSHNFWSNYWFFKFHTFLETASQDLYKSVKINPNWEHLKVAALQGPPPHKACWGYKRLQAPPDQKRKKKKDFLAACSLPGWFLSFSPLFQTQNTHKKYIKVSWFFSSPKIQDSVHTLHLPLLGSIPWIWGSRGYGCSFLATIHSPFSLNLFLAFILLSLALITKFIAFFRMFLTLFVLLA